MFIDSYIPQYPLSQFVQCLWSVAAQTPYKREKILPSLTIELIFNLGSPFKVIDHADPEQYALHKDFWIAGLQKDFIINEPVAETNVMGVRFKPGGAYPFFDFPISELSNEVVEMDLIWGGFANEVREQLLAAQDLATRFNVLEAMLLKRLHSNLYGLNTVQAALGHLTAVDGAVSIRCISEELGTSQKHLNHQFKKMVGASPKLFHRIVKFNQVLNHVNPVHGLNWTELAHHCGYYDQAHFNKDFTSFSGLNPTTYLALREQWFSSELQAGESVHFVPIE
ncbi:helix-turn-helix domain-containing protein [Chloroflexi bacterium TSY]|nr:helix-turn-helix domain-containing protein [Chloroflexi bacterium TSY]